MDIYRLRYPDEMTIDSEQPFSVAIGFFDGLHKGHQAVIQEAIYHAKRLGISSAVMTFDPHPSHLFNKREKKVGYITQPSEKVRLLESMGVDAMFIVTFDWNLASLSPEEFVEKFIKGLQMQHVTAGFDFTFGSKGAGTMKQMAALANGSYETSVVGRVDEGTEKISSTRIRHCLAEGRVEEARQLLGRPLRTVGTVIHGDQRGRLLGFPTANLQAPDELILPAKGVYAVRISFDGETYKGVCNLGVKPTFHDPQEAKPVIEVHIFDFEGDLYGQEVAVDWIAHIREERKFPSIDALKEQITVDKEQAQLWLN